MNARLRSQLANVVLASLALSFVSACGDTGNEAPPPPQAEQPSVPGPATSEPPPTTPAAPSEEPKPDEAPAEPTIREPEPNSAGGGGTKLIPQPRPKSERVAAADQCDGRAGPPKPGLTARYVRQNEIEVRLDLGKPPSSCAAIQTQILLDVNDDTTSGISRYLDVDGKTSYTEVVEIPAAFPGRPDVATAVSTSREGSSSKASRVVISGR